MTSVFKVLVDLAGTQSRLEKEAILKKNKDNEELRETVRLALDSLTQFYIRKIPIVDKHLTRISKGLPWAFEELKKLSRRVVTGTAGINHLVNILEHLNEADGLVIERIIAKDLRCGVNTATANKIWPGLVTDFPCMLASGYEEKLVSKIQWPAIAQCKLDGMRAAVVVDGQNVTLYTRNGKVIDLHDILKIPFLNMKMSSVVYDGELLVTDGNGLANRQTGNGILNKAVKGTITDAECEKVKIVLFDMVSLHHFRNGVCHSPYIIRWNHLQGLLKEHNVCKKLQLVETRQVNNLDETKEFFEEVLKQGEEGIILKDPRSIWENKRSTKQIKFKAELDCDLMCVGWEPGTGKYAKIMGALMLESADGKLKVAVGTGFSDEDRKNLTAAATIGKVVAVRYNAVIQDKNGGPASLFLPRFLEVREDKSTADKMSVIK